MKRWPQDLAALGFGLAAALASRLGGAQPFEDGPYVLGVAWQLAWELRHGQLVEAFQHLASVVAPQPAGAYVPAVLGYTLLGSGPWVPVLVSWLLIWACWDGVRRLSAWLWPERSLWGALVAWGAVASSALVLQSAEQLGVDLVLSACLLQAVSWAAVSEGLGERPASLAAGAWAGACLLVKYSAPLLLLGPLLVMAWELWRRRSAGHLFEAVALAGGVAGPFYLYNRPWILDYLQGSVGPQGAASPSLDQWLFYPCVLALALGWPLLLAAVGGTARALIEQRWRLAQVLGAALGGLLLLAVLELRHAPDPLIPTLARPEYALPCLFAGAVLLQALWVGRARIALGALVSAQALVGLAVFAQPRQGESMPAAVSPSEQGLGWSWPLPAEPFAPPGPLPRAEAWSELRAALCEELPSGTLGLLFDDAHDSAASIGRLLYESQACGARWDLAQIEPRRGGAVRLPFASRAIPPEEPVYELVLQVALPNNPEHRMWLGGPEELGRWEVFPQRPAILYRLR